MDPYMTAGVVLLVLVTLAILIGGAVYMSQKGISVIDLIKRVWSSGGRLWLTARLR